MRVAYIGSTVARDRAHDFSGCSVAGNKYQLGLLSEVEASGARLDRFLVAPLASFPRGRPVIVRMSDDDLGIPGAVAVPYVNVVLLKQLTIAIGLFFSLVRWARRTSGEAERVMVVYNAFSFMAGPVLWASKLTRVPAVVVVADIQPPGGARAMERFEARFQHRAFAKFAAIVQISEQIGRTFAPHLPSLLVEGGTWDSTQPEDRPAGSDESVTTVVFSGALDENSGIRHLMDAFAQIDADDWRLTVLGKGQFADVVEQAAARDPRINFLGYVDNATALEVQRQASVLVSPRLPDDFTTRFSFPSKLMEYLGSGRPVVSSRLEGIPEAYFEHLVVPQTNSAADLARALVSAAQRGDAEGIAQREFVASRSWRAQSRSFAQFLKGLVSAG